MKRLFHIFGFALIAIIIGLMAFIGSASSNVAPCGEPIAVTVVATGSSASFNRTTATTRQTVTVRFEDGREIERRAPPGSHEPGDVLGFQSWCNTEGDLVFRDSLVILLPS